MEIILVLKQKYVKLTSSMWTFHRNFSKHRYTFCKKKEKNYVNNKIIENQISNKSEWLLKMKTD